MEDLALKIGSNSRLFKTAVTPTAVTQTAFILWYFGKQSVFFLTYSGILG